MEQDQIIRNSKTSIQAFSKMDSKLIDGKTKEVSILVFKTDIDNSQKLASVNSYFTKIPEIGHWSVDMEDIDNVLRIETSGSIVEANIIELLSKIDIYCQDLI